MLMPSWLFGMCPNSDCRRKKTLNTNITTETNNASLSPYIGLKFVCLVISHVIASKMFPVTLGNAMPLAKLLCLDRSLRKSFQFKLCTF